MASLFRLFIAIIGSLTMNVAMQSMWTAPDNPVFRFPINWDNFYINENTKCDHLSQMKYIGTAKGSSSKAEVTFWEIFNAHDNQWRTYALKRFLWDSQNGDHFFQTELKARMHIKNSNINNIPKMICYSNYQISILMEAIDGISSDEYFSKQTEFNQDKIIDVMLKTRNIIDQLHRNNVYYLDISSSNILIDKQGQPWLFDADFWTIIDYGHTDWTQRNYWGSSEYFGSGYMCILDQFRSGVVRTPVTQAFAKQGDYYALGISVLKWIQSYGDYSTESDDFNALKEFASSVWVNIDSHTPRFIRAADRQDADTMVNELRQQNVKTAEYITKYETALKHNELFQHIVRLLRCCDEPDYGYANIQYDYFTDDTRRRNKCSECCVL